MIRTIAVESALLLGRDRRMVRPGPKTPVEILLVEDSIDEAEFMIEAIGKGSLTTRVTLVQDGEQAIDYLRCAGKYAGEPRPDLVLLDLHLPRMSGHEVLAEMKQDPVLRRIPVVIMTSSENQRDIVGAYELHANCCVPKPGDHEQLAQVVKRIEQFWLNVATRP